MERKNINKFSALKKGQSMEMTLLITDLKEGIDKNGNSYVTVFLSDGDTTKKINFFNSSIEQLMEQNITIKSIIDIKIERNDQFYNEKGYKIHSDADFTINDFIHAAPIDVDKCFEHLKDQIKSVDSNADGRGEYKSLSHLTIKMLEDYEEKFKRSSAAESMHHNCLSGLLLHTSNMVDLALSFCNAYPSLDKELLVCGTALHDIGKIFCYDTNDLGEASITPLERLLGHPYVGSVLVREAAKKDSYDNEKILLLTHMIVSHHGEKEWGAIVNPAFPEAFILHELDIIDSKKYIFDETNKNLEPGELSEKVYGLYNNSVFKPNNNNEQRGDE